MPSAVRITDGSLDFSAGVDSGRVPTIESNAVPNGLKRNQLAWLTNGTVRGGGVMSRLGWKKLCEVHDPTALYQGGMMYSPPSTASNNYPHIVVSIGGILYRIRVDTDNSVEDISAGLLNPAGEPQAFFVQAENWMVIQAGDYTTLPLIYDGGSTIRSGGLPTQWLPAAGPMDYYQGRIWYANGRTYTAGDIVGSAVSGTPPFYRDSVLRVTENPLAIGGDGFSLPSNEGVIRAITHTAELDAALGEGRLLIGSRKAIYRLTVPVSRTNWIAAGRDNMPLQTMIQNTNGFINDRSIVRVNGDLFYQSMDGVRSLGMATRLFNTWANTPISANVDRALKFNDRALLRYSSGIEFDNRLWQTVLPYQTAVGVAHKGILPLDFDPVSSLQEKIPPDWEGMYEGLHVLQLFSGDFGGLERAFAVVLSERTGKIECWEFTTTERFDMPVTTEQNRVTWIVETPAYTWGNPFQLKELETLELWIDKMFGTIEFEVYWRPDQHPCWFQWFAWKDCAAKGPEEDPMVDGTVDVYPTQPYCEQYRATKVLPKPPTYCAPQANRPAHIAYQIQLKIVIKGWCRIRGLLVHALPRDKAPFEGIVCGR